jgi:hypothetical protein
VELALPIAPRRTFFTLPSFWLFYQRLVFRRGVDVAHHAWVVDLDF